MDCKRRGALMKVAEMRFTIRFGIGVISTLIALVGLSSARVKAQSNVTQGQPERFERSFPMAAGGTIYVENRKGAIRVTGTDTDKVTIRVEKRISGGNEKQREQWLADTKVDFANEVANEANRLTVRVEYPDMNCTFCSNTEDEVELTIAAPRQVNLELEGAKPEIAVSSVEGHIRISSRKSAIELKRTTGGVRIDTEKGNVRLEDVALQGLRVTSRKADAVIAAKSVAADVDLETEKGSFVLRMPSTVGLNLDYRGGRRATFHCDFPVTINGDGMELRNVSGRVRRNGTHITGKLNQGGPETAIWSTRGSVSIEKAP